MNVKNILIIGLILVIIAVVLGFLSSGFTNWNFNRWFNSDIDNSTNDSTTNNNSDSSDNDLVIDDVVNNGILLNSTLIDKNSYNSYGISTSIDSAYLFTANVGNSSISDLSWSVSWQNTSSDFAKINDISDYVSLKKYNDTLNVIVLCNKAFGKKLFYL